MYLYMFLIIKHNKKSIEKEVQLKVSPIQQDLGSRKDEIRDQLPA